MGWIRERLVAFFAWYEVTEATLLSCEHQPMGRCDSDDCANQALADRW